MNREEKKKTIDELAEKIERSSIGILADYRGLNTARMNQIRRKLNDSSTEFHVVKNSLAQFAAGQAGREELAGLFEGPVALALGYEDEVGTAKALVDYIRAEKLEVGLKSGFMADRVLDEKDVQRLASLPAREVLIAQLLGNVQSPIYGIVNVLAGPIRNIMGVLNARVKQLEEG